MSTRVAPLAAPVARAIRCKHCSSPYDPATASICGCITQHRTLRCPTCGQCSCSAGPSGMRSPFANAESVPPLRRLREERQRENRPSPAPGELRRPLVVVADDDFDIRAVVRRTLESRGYGVVAVEDGEQAWEAIQNLRPEIALLDGLMPRADGRVVAKRVKDEPRLSTKCVLMTSLYTSAVQKAEAFTQFGIDAHLSKPVHPDVLDATLRRLLPD